MLGGSSAADVSFGISTEIRKRKSRFDVGPISLEANDSYSHSGGIYSDEKLLLTISLASESSKDSHLSFLLPSQPYKSVVEQAFKDRLAKALIKNFEYILRKERQLLDHVLVTHEQSNASSDWSKDIYNKHRKNPGIGMSASVPHIANNFQESHSVYVTGLPLDITQDELDILFSASGKLKKIKIYKNSKGQPKGDCLVTFVKADSANLACIQFNNLNIGDGFIIQVSKADFSNQNAPEEADCQALELRDDEIVEILQQLDTQIKCHPFVIFRNIYNTSKIKSLSVGGDQSLFEKYFTDLEADLLLECCKFGHVVKVLSPEEDHQFGDAVVVIFMKNEDASRCVETCNGKLFDGQPLQARFVSIPEGISRSACQASVASMDLAPVIEGPDDVDDFLNSLL